MSPDEMTNLLRLRRELTGENFNDNTIQAWSDAFATSTVTEVRAALIGASRDHPRLTVAHVIERLPIRPRAETPPPPTWDGPTDGGRRVMAQIQQHMRHRRDGRHDDCPMCTGTPFDTDDPEPDLDQGRLPLDH